MKRFFCALLALVIFICQLGCGRETLSKITIDTFLQQKQITNIEWNDTNTITSIKPYTVESDLSNIKNISDFQQLSELDKYMLSSNMFTIKKSEEYFEQPFELYEKNKEECIPNFITCDSILHVYHLMYDYILRNVESERLIGELKIFTEGAFQKSLMVYNGVNEKKAKDAALKNVAYFGIAMRLMGIDLPGGIPLEANRIIDNDVKKVRIRWGNGTSEIFPYLIDYSKYIARGHYTRDAEFNNYFLTMMWYGNTPLMFDTYDAKSGTYSRMDEQIAMAVIMSSVILCDDNLRSLWEDIYGVTAAFCGKGEDANLYDMSDIIRVMYGKNIDLNKIWDNTMIQKVYELTKQRYNLHAGETIAGRINISNTNVKTQVQFRLMGQMYNVDTDIYSSLASSNNQETGLGKQLPNGLDIPSAFGSEEAFSVLQEQAGEIETLDQFPSNVRRLRGVFSGISGDNPLDYSFNNSVFWALKSIIKPHSSGYPSFMLNSSWSNKNLLTFAGTVSDSRHPTYLVSKQAENVEKEESPEQIIGFPGYVEPEADLYSRLEYMARYMKSFLSLNNYQIPGIYNALDCFTASVSFLNRISNKELANISFSDEEAERLKDYGEELRLLSLCMVEGKSDLKCWDTIPIVDRNMASVYDAYAWGSNVMQTAIGPPDCIYVVIPYEDKLYLTRGGVYSYYEFINTASRKLEDKEWQSMLRDGKEIEQQIWIKRVRY